MNNIIEFNSWDKNFKAPFGALKVNENIKIKVNVSKDFDVEKLWMLIYKEDDFFMKKELLKVTKGAFDEEEKYEYSVKLNDFKETGVYFYYFEVEVNTDGKKLVIPYGKYENNGHACKYDYLNINKYQLTVHEDFKVPKWFKEGILYHIFVDKFNNGNRNKQIINPKKNSFIYANWEDDPMYIKDDKGDIVRWDFHGGNLKGIISKLGYLKRLGVSIIYLSPVFEAGSNHKYDTGDYKKIDPMFGDEEIFKELIDKAKEKGMSIILDGVFSHTGADSKYFNRFNNYDIVGAYQSKDSKYHSWYSFKEYPDEYKCWWDIKALPNTNEMEPSFKDYIIHDEDSVIKKWTNMGIRGWRLDVADELPTKFIQDIKTEIKNINNDNVLIGEVWEDASNKVAYDERRNYFKGDQLDSVMGYPFRKNLLSFLKGEISSTQLNDLYMHLKENYPSESFKANLNLIGTHDVGRIKTELNNDKELMKLSVVTQMMSEGVPYIYYGDEAGLSGKTDPDNRKTYPWQNEDKKLVDFYKNMISLRKKNKAIVNGDTRFVYTVTNSL